MYTDLMVLAITSLTVYIFVTSHSLTLMTDFLVFIKKSKHKSLSYCVPHPSSSGQKF